MALAKIATHKQAIIDIDDHKMVALAFNQHLDTVPLVFVHGFGASVNFWNGWQTDYVQQHCKWYSLSLPGHYPATFPSDFDPAEINADRLAEITTRALKKLVGNQRIILIGHSTGGFTALNVAMHAPQMVQAVASVAGFVQGTWTGSLGIFQRISRMGPVGRRVLWAVNRMSMVHIQVFSLIDDTYAHNVRAMNTHPDYMTSLPHFYADAKVDNVAALTQWLDHVQNIDISAGLGTISAPALVMVGQQDPIVPPQQAHIIHRGIPHSELIEYPDTGHMMMFERADAYHRDLTAWLKNVM
ncbi:MAG: alpha/beta hydrolase [Chloroflexota bacterium]